jgi:type IV secretion system protein VirB1
MLPGVELMACPNLAVAPQVMHHVVRVESSYNPYAIGVVGGRLVRQPKNLPEAVSTAQMLEEKGFNFSLGLAQVNRYNLQKYGLNSYQNAFDKCPNLQAGSKILAECYNRLQDWGKAFSCYYSGNSVTGFKHGYVQKIYASMRRDLPMSPMAVNRVEPIAVIGNSTRKVVSAPTYSNRAMSVPRIAAQSRMQKRIVVDASPSASNYQVLQESEKASQVATLSASATDLPVAAQIIKSTGRESPVLLRPTNNPGAAASQAATSKDSAFVF